MSGIRGFQSVLSCTKPLLQLTPARAILAKLISLADAGRTSQILLDSDVDLGNDCVRFSVGALLLQLLSKLLPRLNQAFAMTAPRSIELDKPITGGSARRSLRKVLEVLVREHLNE